MFSSLLLLAAIGAASAAPSVNVSAHNHALNIVGGTVTDIALYPYQVSVQYYYQHFCGGFLISPNWVVTAAHCLTNRYNNNLNIRAGSTLTTSGGQTVTVARFIIPAKYDDEDLNNDIALLQLTSAVTINTANIATLPSENELIIDGATITATGWGSTREGGFGSPNLMKVDVPIVNQNTCKNSYASIRPITDSMFCAGIFGVGGSDACQGDSGGPASYNGKVIGIISWGEGCGRARYPGVYARIPVFREWIRQNTGI